MPQCQFLFSAIFGFRNLTKEIFSELDDSKAKVPIFHVPMQWTWREVKMGCREPTPCLGAGPGQAAPIGGVAALWLLFDSPSDSVFVT